jgi:CDI toxin RNase A-like protein
MTKRFPIFAAAFCAVLALTSCQSPPGAASTAATRTEARAESGQGSPRDLSQDEAAGGHVLRKHVGRTDDQLRKRLEHERNISGASTYTDRATAEHAIGAAIAISQDRIQSWLDRTGNRPNLVLDYDSPQPIGRTINRGDAESRPCSHALVVLKYSVPSYYVLTSYPECRS